MSGYVGFDTRAGRPFYVGDLVTAEDEWGYWRDDPAEATGTIESSHGWLTTLVRAGGVRFIVDGHTTRMYHAEQVDR